MQPDAGSRFAHILNCIRKSPSLGANKLAAARIAIREQLAGVPVSGSVSEVAVAFARNAVRAEFWDECPGRREWVLSWRYARLSSRRLMWLISPRGRAEHFSASLIREQWAPHIMRTKKC